MCWLPEFLDPGHGPAGIGLSTHEDVYADHVDFRIVMPAEMAFGQDYHAGGATVGSKRMAMAEKNGGACILAGFHENIGYRISVKMVSDSPEIGNDMVANIHAARIANKVLKLVQLTIPFQFGGY